MKVVLPVLLRVLWAAVVVVRAAPTPTRQIPDVIGTGRNFDITRIFPDLAGVRSSSDPSYPPILVLGSNSDISPAALRDFVRVSRQSLPHDSTDPEDVLGDGRESLEDNLVYDTVEDFDSREDSGDVVIQVPSSFGVPLSASDHSIATGSGTSTLITDEADLDLGFSAAGPQADFDLGSSAAGPTSAYVTPGTDAPVSTSAPSVQYSAPQGLPQGLQLLLNRHADRMTDPSMTLGSFLQGLNGKDGVMVLPASSLDAVQNAGVSVSVSDPSSSEFDITSVDVRHNIGDGISRSDVVSDEGVADLDLDLDLESREDDSLRIIVSSNPSTESSVVATTTTTTAATTTTTTRRTVTTTTLSPTLFQGPLTELLYSKGQFFGTIIGSLLDLGTIIMNRIMNFKPF